nr:condensation domain-containing protein [uncultured bacterium]
MGLSRGQSEALRRLSRGQHATLYMTLLAGPAVLLSRHAGRDDIVVGTPVANRQEARLEDLIGFFVNTLVMRVRVDGRRSFAELLSR